MGADAAPDATATTSRTTLAEVGRTSSPVTEGLGGPGATASRRDGQFQLVSEQLERRLGLGAVVVIALSAMLGSGLFVLPALAMQELGGQGIWLAYLIAGLVVLPSALSKSELATAMPTSGGAYIYIERTYGALLGTISGLGLWTSFMLKSAFALIGFAAYLAVVQPPFMAGIDPRWGSIGLLVLIVVINILGVKRVKTIQTPIILVAVSTLVLLALWSLFSGDADTSLVTRRSAFGEGTSLVTTAAFVFVSYAGVTKVAAVAEEIRDPGRNLPRGMLISLAIATALYAGTLYAMMAVVDPSDLVHTVGGHEEAREDPMYVWAVLVGGGFVGHFVAVLAILTMASMALAGILAASRFPFAMARDNLLPQVLEDVNAEYETPHWAIIGTGVAMGIAIMWLPVHEIAALASGFKIMVFIAVNSCVLVLRHATPSHAWYQPEYRVPLFPLTPILGILLSLGLLVALGWGALIGALVAAIVGSIAYFGYGRSRAHPKTTPWSTMLLMFRDADEAEHRRRVSVFEAVDEAGHGHLTLSEFQRAMRALGTELTMVELRELFHQLDRNEDGVLDHHVLLDELERAAYRLELEAQSDGLEAPRQVTTVGVLPEGRTPDRTEEDA